MHQITMQNKFLRKCAAVGAKVPPTQNSEPSTFEKIKDGIDAVGLTWGTGVGLKDLADLRERDLRLRNYQAGKAAEGYDPMADIKALSSVADDEKFSTKIGEWIKNNPNHKWTADFKRLRDNRHALGYAANNPQDFRKFTAMRNMGMMDYLLGSTKSNYDLMRLAQGPLGKFMNPEQRKLVRNNFGLMELIWRIKKFFSEFGNWKTQADPSELHKAAPHPTIRSNSAVQSPAQGAATSRPITKPAGPSWGDRAKDVASAVGNRLTRQAARAFNPVNLAGGGGSVPGVATINPVDTLISWAERK